MPRRVYPLPEAIAPDHWEVREGQPYIDFTGQYLSVPLDDGPEAVFLRAHEQAHLRWTPGKDSDLQAEAKDLGWATLQAVEDCRMHALLATAGVDLAAGGLKPADRKALVEGLVKAGNAGEAALCAIAAYGTGDYPDLAAAFEGTPALRSAVQLAAEVRWKLAADGQGITDFRNALAVARWLEGVIGRGPRGAGAGGLGHPLCRLYGGPSVRTADAPLFGPAPDGRPGVPLPPVQGLVPWGRMTVAEPDRPLPACPRKATFRAEDAGSFLRGPHRLLSDGRVFATRRRHKGGSVLVDFSGSMSLKETDLERLLANAPASVIAVYSGDRDKGVLKVLARDGRRVTGDQVRRPSGSCNVIDGPALDWLAAQAEPRFWLSDGMVTGVGDTAGTGNTLYANTLCEDARVTRVRTAAELFVYLRRNPRVGRR